MHNNIESKYESDSIVSDNQDHDTMKYEIKNIQRRITFNIQDQFF